MIKDYYKILGLEKDASPESIKSAYRQLAKKYHPDINRSPGADEKFIEITEAYEFLTNKNLQKHYVSFEADTIDDLIRAEYERARRAAQENARRYARMKYEKFKKEQEAFKRSGWYDVGLLLHYIFRILVFPIITFFIAIPVISEEVSEHWSGYVIFWMLAAILVFYVINNRKNYFKLGGFYYGLEDLKKAFQVSREQTNEECYYCKGHKANSIPYKITLFKVIDIQLRSYGAVYGREAGVKRKTTTVQIPRSKKAFIVHLSTSIIKTASILFTFLIINKEPFKDWNLIIGIFLGGAVSSLLLMITGTRSKVSYLLSYGLMIKIIIWLISFFFFKGYALLLLFFDPMIEALLRYISDDDLFKPILPQDPELIKLFNDKYQLYLELPVWSVLFPFFKWLF